MTLVRSSQPRPTADGVGLDRQQEDTSTSCSRSLVLIYLRWGHGLGDRSHTR
jgi:hypothetical protein